MGIMVTRGTFQRRLRRNFRKKLTYIHDTNKIKQSLHLFLSSFLFQCYLHCSFSFFFWKFTARITTSVTTPSPLDPPICWRDDEDLTYCSHQAGCVGKRGVLESSNRKHCDHEQVDEEGHEQGYGWGGRNWYTVWSQYGIHVVYTLYTTAWP